MLVEQPLLCVISTLLVGGKFTFLFWMILTKSFDNLLKILEVNVFFCMAAGLPASAASLILCSIGISASKEIFKSSANNFAPELPKI